MRLIEHSRSSHHRFDAPRARATFPWVLLVFCLCLMSAELHAAPVTYAVEAESLTGAPREQSPGASPANAPVAVVFDQNVQQLAYSSPSPLPKGPVWVMARIKRKSAPAKIMVSVDSGESMAVELNRDDFLNFRFPAQSSGQGAITLNLTWVSGSALIDRIDFVQATDAVAFPSGAAPAAPTKIHVIHGRSAAAKSQAATYQQRLVEQGLPALAPVPATSNVRVDAGETVVVWCEGWNWDEAAALKYLPTWISQTNNRSDAVAYKPAGILGNYAAIGYLAGKANAPSRFDLDIFQGRMPAPLASQSDKAINAQELIGKDSPALVLALGRADKGSVLDAARSLLAWLDSIDSLKTPVSSGALTNLEAALGNCLYRSTQWELTQAERILLGSLFFRLALGTHDILRKEMQGESFAPESLQRALGLLTAAEAFAPMAVAAEWRKSAEEAFAKAQNSERIETTRGRLITLQCLLAYEARMGKISLPAKTLAQSLSLFTSPEAGVCTFGNEVVRLDHATVEQAMPSLIRRSPAESAISIPGAGKDAGNHFDKIMLQGPIAALIDGVSLGAGGYDDAGSLLWLSRGKTLWVAGPGPDQSQVDRQNGISIQIDSSPVAMEPMASSVGSASGKQQKIVLVSRGSDHGVAWRRGLFSFSGAVLLLDEVTPPNAGRLEVAAAVNLIGDAKEDSPGRVIVRSGESQMTAQSLSSGQSSLESAANKPSLFRQVWSGTSDPKSRVFLRTAFLFDGANAPTALSAPGIRLGANTAAFLGPVALDQLRIESQGSSFSGGEIVLAQATRLDLNEKTYLESTAPVDIALRAEAMTVQSDRPASMALRVPAGVTASGAQNERSAETIRFSLVAGVNEISFSTPDALKEVFAAVPSALASVPEGEYGIASAAPSASAFPEQFVVLRTMPSTEGVEHLLPLNDAQTALSMNKSVAIASASQIGKTIATLESPITALQKLDADADGSPELVTGCADGSVHLVDLQGEKLGEANVDDSSAVDQLQPLDIDKDGLSELAVLLKSGKLAVLDALGQKKWQHQLQPDARWAFEDFDGDGRVEGVIASPDGARQLLRFQPDSKIETTEFPENKIPATSCLAIATEAAVPSIIFGQADGSIEVYAWENGFEKKGAVKALPQSITTLKFDADRKQIFAGSSAGDVAAISVGAWKTEWTRGTEAAINEIHILPDGNAIALTSKPSLFLLSREGNIRAQKNLDAPARSGLVSFVSGDRPALSLATDKGITSYVWGRGGVE